MVDTDLMQSVGFHVQLIILRIHENEFKQVLWGRQNYPVIGFLLLVFLLLFFFGGG